MENTARFTQNDGSEAPAAAALMQLSMTRENSQKVARVVRSDITISFMIEERKKGKRRELRVSPSIQKIAASCRIWLRRQAEDSFVFFAEGKDIPMTSQAVDLMLKKARVKYRVKSAQMFSSLSLRKTFGHRVWL